MNNDINIFDMDSFPYSKRLINCFAKSYLNRDVNNTSILPVVYLNDLILQNKQQILSIKNLGKTSLDEIEKWLKTLNLKFEE